MNTFRVSVCMAIFLAGTPAFAKPLFLSPSEYDPARLLPAPPADGSPQQIAEAAELDRIQTARTPAEVAHAKIDGKTENATIFQIAIGPEFDLAALPATAKLMDDVRNDEKEAAKAGKNLFQRNRPWVADANLQPCARNDDPKSSYPSGHATMAYSMAVVLASLVPEKAQAILARANDYAEGRLVCGQHYRRDIVAGEALGTAVATALLHNAQFRVEYDAAETELKAAHLTR